jgi:hypothetical protein
VLQTLDGHEQQHLAALLAEAEIGIAQRGQGQARFLVAAGCRRGCLAGAGRRIQTLAAAGLLDVAASQGATTIGYLRIQSVVGRQSRRPGTALR